MTFPMRSLIATAALFAVSFSSTAFAEEHAGAAAHDEEPHDTPGFIMHHLMDGDAYTFELPWPGLEHQPTINLGEIFKGLRFERTPGACEQPIDPASPWAAAPSLRVWLNGCIDLRPTKAVLMMWLASALLLIFAFTFAPKGKATDSTGLVPRGVGQNVLEVLYLYVRDEVVVKNIGAKEAPRYTAYLTSIFFFVLFCNWLGLVPNFGSATGQLGVTGALAVMTLILTFVAGVRSAGPVGFVKHMTQGTPWPMWPLMVPVELLGMFVTKPLALMVRLFANMLAGHLALLFILGLIFLITPWVAFGAVPLAIGIYLLEIFVGLLQAYIFTLLTAIFIGLSVQMGEHGDHGHGEEHAEGHAAH